MEDVANDDEEDGVVDGDEAPIVPTGETNGRADFVPHDENVGLDDEANRLRDNGIDDDNAGEDGVDIGADRVPTNIEELVASSICLFIKRIFVRCFRCNTETPLFSFNLSPNAPLN